ncbi:MAG: DUF2970 domain-containing protein [Methylophilaceae bacterium]
MNQSELDITSESDSKKPASMHQVIKAVCWCMLGVRGQKGYEKDIAKITLKQAVIAGLIGAVIFVVSVLTLVNLAITYMQ